MLKLSDISHRYGESWVLRNQNLTLKPGERLAVMGPSGCGKTTLLRIALELLRPTAGTVTNTFSAVGAVFQEPRLLPGRTALENVNLVLGDRKKTLEKAGAYLKLLGLTDAEAKFPGELSGGMQQRVALARALALEADLLILDEPFKALDDALRQQVMEAVDQTGAAILLVTHDEQEANRLGCRILRLQASPQV